MLKRREGNYWGHSSEPGWLPSDTNDPNIVTDSYPYLLSGDRWDAIAIGTKQLCSCNGGDDTRRQIHPKKTKIIIKCNSPLVHLRFPL